jgi:hypothetical protein
MKHILLLFPFSLLLLSSCSDNRPPIDVPDGFLDTMYQVGKEKTYEPDSICYFKYELKGELIGEWVEVGITHGSIVSELECVTIDTTGFSTRHDSRWVFENDSDFVWYSGDLTIGTDSNELFLPGGNPHYCRYELRGAHDSLFVTDNDRFHDTVRITRLDDEYMFIGRITRLSYGQDPVVFTTVYKRRK